MPHVAVKLYPGRSEEAKKAAVEKIVKAVEEALEVDPIYISVSVEEIEPERWGKDIYKPEILDKEDKLYKKPGYRPEGI